MKFYADISVPWDVIARFFPQCKHLLSKMLDQMLLKTLFSWKKKLVGHFHFCNNSEKLFLTNSIHISFPVSGIHDIFLWGYVCVSLLDYFSCQESSCFLTISDKTNILFYLLGLLLSDTN